MNSAPIPRSGVPTRLN